MKKLLLTAALCAFAAPAYATVTCFSGATLCATDAETKIFLDKLDGKTANTGHFGSQTGLPIVDFGSVDKLNFASGFATIKPAAGKDFTGEVDFSIPGYTFGDLVYDAQLFKADASNLNFTITAWLDGNEVGTHTYNNVQHDADITYDVTGLFDEITLTSPTGFKELKHFEVSDLMKDPTSGVPEPSTWAMMALGFAGLGFLGYRKTRRDNALA